MPSPHNFAAPWAKTTGCFACMLAPWLVLVVLGRSEASPPWYAFPPCVALTVAALGCLCGRSLLSDLGACFHGPKDDDGP